MLQPKSTFRALAARLQGREDSEHEQATIRVVLGVLTCAYLLTLDFSGEEGAWARVMLAIVVTFLSGALIIYAAILFRPAKAPLRRIAGICLDLSATSAAMGVAGETGAPLLAIYLWVIVGNGFRFGNRYLLIATAVALLGFGAVVLFSEFWNSHPIFSVGYMIVLLIIPGYTAALLKKLNEAIRRANEASQAKSRFLANMSHELRTPLNGVIGMADLLIDSPLGPEQETFARTIQNSARTLLGIIEDVLDFAKIEAGRIAIETIPFDLHSLVNETVHLLRIQAQRKGLRLNLQVDPRVPFELIGDPLHLQQILLNLLGNAVKFTDEGWVALRVEAVETPTRVGRLRVRFEIEDTGIGISEDEQEHIFESFRQAERSTSRLYGGTGLGTAIALELAHLLGGDIGLRSERGSGTLFWVELPFLPQSDPGVVRLQNPGDNRVLVVGKREATEPLCAALTEWQMDYTPVESSAGAFAELLQEREGCRAYSVLLAVVRDLDLEPRQFVATIRADDRLQETGLVLVGASPAHGTSDSLCEAVYSGVPSSPLDKGQLFNAIHATRSAQQAPDNVVSPIDHYRKLAKGAEQGLRILVAEDNETNRKVLKSILERVGHQVTLAADGESALDALERDGEHLDLMILDKNMPGRSGLEVYKAYRFMAQRPIPGIMLTADATPDARRACDEAGIEAYLTKPVDTLKLLETVARLCDRSDQARVKPRGPMPTAAVTGKQAQHMLLDVEKLRALARLGSRPGFFDDLVAGFVCDGRRSLIRLTEALAEQDFPALRAANHALRGSAGEIGAALIVELTLELRTIKPHEMGSKRAGQILGKLRETFEATEQGLAAFPRDPREGASGAGPPALTPGPWPDERDDDGRQGSSAATHFDGSGYDPHKHE